ncbi:DUF4253 domain-containing protein [Streptomyces sp. KLOTTS4A1]|uniref:DUF4253 domain-containing protein n=1 Tax=Streptomyces sp. KLOTTS4A1 TaxID=3390996 RepID=UPI0039F5B180
MVMFSNVMPQLVADPGGGALGLELPAGRLVDETVQGTWHVPLLWLAEQPATPGEWTAHEAAWRAAELCPVLMDIGGHRGGPEGWDLLHDQLSDPGDLEDEDMLSIIWDEIWEDRTGRAFGYGLPGGPDEVASRIAPYGPRWPGLAPQGTPVADPEAHATETAEALVAGSPFVDHSHLALVPAWRSADIPAAIGWNGALAHIEDPGVLSCVLRSWEERFGARLVALTEDRVVLSVAAPPATRAAAEALAAEHFALCPDLFTYGRHETLREYAAQEVADRPLWTFRWSGTLLRTAGDDTF